MNRKLFASKDDVADTTMNRWAATANRELGFGRHRTGSPKVANRVRIRMKRLPPEQAGLALRGGLRLLPAGKDRS